jgi:hypothetical protein
MSNVFFKKQQRRGEMAGPEGVFLFLCGAIGAGLGERRIVFYGASC